MFIKELHNFDLFIRQKEKKDGYLSRFCFTLFQQNSKRVIEVSQTRQFYREVNRWHNSETRFLLSQSFERVRASYTCATMRLLVHFLPPWERVFVFDRKSAFSKIDFRDGFAPIFHISANRRIGERRERRRRRRRRRKHFYQTVQCTAYCIVCNSRGDWFHKMPSAW